MLTDAPIVSSWLHSVRLIYDVDLGKPAEHIASMYIPASSGSFGRMATHWLAICCSC
jgi:hypothetical protein